MLINICSSPAARRERRGRTKTNESRCWLTVVISWCWCGPWSTWILLQLKEFFYVHVHVHFQFPFCSFFHPSSLLYCTYLTLPPLSFLLLHFLYHFSNHIVPLELHPSIDSRVGCCCLGSSGLKIPPPPLESAQLPLDGSCPDSCRLRSFTLISARSS